MSLATLPVRAAKSIRQDGVDGTLATASWKARSRWLLPVCRRLVTRFPRVTREELRDRATIREGTATDAVPFKGATGLPSAEPRYWYLPGDRFVTELADARVIGRKGLLLDRGGRIVPEATTIPPIYPRREALALEAAITGMGTQRTYEALTGAPERRIDRPVAHLLSPFPSNYYHALIEQVPKLRMLARFGRATGTYPAVLVPEDRPTWFDDLLDAVGYPGKRIPWGNEVATVERCIVPSFPDPVREECDWLRRSMLDGDIGAGRRLFVTREDVGHRRLANRDAVGAALASRGFEAYCPGEHAIREQARAFAAADVVVGVHGAGLANTVFSRDAAVIEVAASKELASYARLADICGNEYRRVSARAVHGDVLVGVQRLTEVIETL